MESANEAHGYASSTKSVYQVALPRRQLLNDSAILDFLLANVGWFDMYVEDDHAAHVRYCFEKQLDAEIFRAYSIRNERLTLTR
jgi:hypothetical protein